MHGIITSYYAKSMAAEWKSQLQYIHTSIQSKTHTHFNQIMDSTMQTNS